MKPTVLLILIIFIVGCKSPEARPHERVKTGSFIKQSAERNIKLNEREYAIIQTIIDNNPENTYITSESGFWYYYNNQVVQDTIRPNFGDIVNFSYDVKDLNGNVIYSEQDLNVRDYVMDKEELFTGLREGLKLMKPVLLLITSDLLN